MLQRFERKRIWKNKKKETSREETNAGGLRAVCGKLDVYISCHYETERIQYPNNIINQRYATRPAGGPQACKAYIAHRSSITWSRGVAVSTLDSESSDCGSNRGGINMYLYIYIYIYIYTYIHIHIERERACRRVRDSKRPCIHSFIHLYVYMYFFI